jgi:hypothetical protein
MRCVLSAFMIPKSFARFFGGMCIELNLSAFAGSGTRDFSQALSGVFIPLRTSHNFGLRMMLGSYQDKMHVQIPTESAWRGAPRYILTGSWTPCYPAVDAGAPTSGMSTWKSSGCVCRHTDHLGYLGAVSQTLTPQQALQMAMQMYSGQHLNPKDDFMNNAGLVAAGQLASPTGCSGKTAPNMNLLSTATGISLSVAGAATGIMVATHVISAVTGAILGAATLGIGALISVIGMIFAHHAAAKARDASFACSAWPAVNNAFAVINQAVHSGQTTPAAAIAALDEVYSQFMAAGGASGSASGPGNIPSGGTAINNHPYCNSNCVTSVILKAMVLYWQSQYNAMASSAAASTTVPSTATQNQIAQLQTQAAAAQAKGDVATANALTTQANVLQQQATQQAAASSGGVPSFAWLAAAAVAAFFFLK